MKQSISNNTTTTTNNNNNNKVSMCKMILRGYTVQRSKLLGNQTKFQICSMLKRK